MTKLTPEKLKQLKTHEKPSELVARLISEGKAKVVGDVAICGGQKIRITLFQYRGRVDFRTWDFRPDIDEWRPTKRGISFSLRFWPEVKKALEKIDSLVDSLQVNSRIKGTCTVWFTDKGYGFVQANGERFFVHISQIDGEEPLTTGDVVEFKVGRGKHGKPDALNVRKCQIE